MKPNSFSAAKVKIINIHFFIQSKKKSITFYRNEGFYYKNERFERIYNAKRKKNSYICIKIRHQLMLISLIHSLPSIVSLLWFFSFMLKEKTPRQQLFFCAEGISVIFYAILAVYFFPMVDYETMVKMETASIPAGISLCGFIVAYMYMHYSGKQMSGIYLSALQVPAIVLCTAVGLLCYIIGFEQAADVSRQFATPEGLVGAFNTEINRLYCFFTYDMFMIESGFYVALIMILCLATLRTQGYRFGDVFRFFFKGKQTTRSRSIAVMYILEMLLIIIMMATGSVYLTKHVLLGILITVALAATKHIIAYLEFYSDDDKTVTLYELSHLTLYKNENLNENLDPNENLNENENENSLELKDLNTQELKNSPTQELKKSDDIVHSPSSLINSQAKVDDRIEQFRELMETKKIWRNEELTSQHVCEMMNIGKTTFSLLVNQYYNMPFRDLVNKYRIEEAKRYMIANPTATQEVVAQHCGFKNAQYFNAQFKKTVGDTPAMWLASLAGDK